MITLTIGILITIVLGAILFWVIDRFCPDARLEQLLKLLVVLICLGSIVVRLLPLLGYATRFLHRCVKTTLAGPQDSYLRIPTKPAMHSNLKPATYTDLKPATVPI